MARRRDLIGSLDVTGSVFAPTAITVTENATALPTTNMDNRKAISIRNWSSGETIYIGNNNVTSATGFPIRAQEALPFDLSSGAKVYGICETGKTADCRVIEVDNG